MSYFNRFDICEAAYVFASLWHGGQDSEIYTIFGRLQNLDFHPAMDLGLESLSPNGKLIYENFKQHYKCSQATDNFSDRTDACIRTSLYEYGFIRNSTTNKCIWCINPIDQYDFPEGSYSIKWKPIIRVSYIDFNDVLNWLEEDATDGFFNFIDGFRDDMIETLHNNNLAYIITSAMQYDGTFYPGEY